MGELEHSYSSEVNSSTPRALQYIGQAKKNKRTNNGKNKKGYRGICVYRPKFPGCRL
jgi:hypothetical protein